MSDKEWAKLYEEYRFVKRLENQNLSTELQYAAIELLNLIFKKD